MDSRAGPSRRGVSQQMHQQNFYGSAQDDWRGQNLGCSHYRRKCQLVCPEKVCERLYTCRICHDEQEGHKFDRYKVTIVSCLVCKFKQPVAEECAKCNTIFGRYFCGHCNFFSDDDKGFYHCFRCGLCRVGPAQNYFHCKKCDVCLSIDLQDNHKCIERASMSECPLCFEDLHTSRIQSKVLPCGHLIHATCLQELLTKGHEKCPTCRENIPEKFKETGSTNLVKE